MLSIKKLNCCGSSFRMIQIIWQNIRNWSGSSPNQFVFGAQKFSPEHDLNQKIRDPRPHSLVFTQNIWSMGIKLQWLTFMTMNSPTLFMLRARGILFHTSDVFLLLKDFSNENYEDKFRIRNIPTSVVVIREHYFDPNFSFFNLCKSDL